MSASIAKARPFAPVRAGRQAGAERRTVVVCSADGKPMQVRIFGSLFREGGTAIGAVRARDEPPFGLVAEGWGPVGW